MARSLAQRRVLAGALREAIVSLCSGLGVLVGIWWMLSTPVVSRACTNTAAERTSSTVITGCARQVILDSALHYALGIIGGALIGAAVGLLLARLIPRPAGHRRLVHSRAVPATGLDSLAVLSAPGPGASERWITARYAGRCASCSQPVSPGDRVRHRPGRVSCERCSTAPVAR